MRTSALVTIAAAGVLVATLGCNFKNKTLPYQSDLDRRGAVIPRHIGPLAEHNDRIRSMDYDPEDYALAWPNDDEIIISHTERYSKADVGSFTCEGTGIFSITLSTDSVRTITTGDPICRATRKGGGLGISPNGQWIVYSARTLPNSSLLFRIDLATQREDSLPAKCDIYFGQPAVSPDGHWIAGEGQCTSRNDQWGLYVVRENGSDLRNVSPSDSTNMSSPAWDPTSKHLAFQEIRKGEHSISYIATLDLTDGTYRRLGTGWYPSWSPDGQWIAFIAMDSDELRNSEIWVIRPDGTEKRRVFQNRVRSKFFRGWGPILEGQPSDPLIWSPNSREVAFTRGYDAGSSVWRVDLATGTATPVTKPSQ